MTDAERIKQLEAEASEWKWEYENVCKFTTGYEQQRDELREENRKLEAENLVLMNAIQQIDAGILPDGSHVESVVVLFAESVLEKCQNTLQLQKEREADLALVPVLELIERRCGSVSKQSAHTDALECASIAREALAERDRVYAERK